MTLRARLILVFLTLTLGTTALVGTLAYSAAQRGVRDTALRVVSIIAHDRHTALVQRLNRQLRRGTRFMAQTPACTRIPLDRAACDRAVHAFAVEEQLIAAAVVDSGRVVVRVTTATNDAIVGHPALLEVIPLLQPGQLARFALDAANFAYYDVAAPVPVRGEDRADLLLLRYALPPDEPLFSAGIDLGVAGETFLADAAGHPLTRLRFPMTVDSAGAITAAPMRDCLRGRSGEAVGNDYRDARIIHGYEYVPEIGGGCVMAHMDQDEAERPVTAIRERLAALGVVLALCAIVVSIVLARQIAGPLTALVESADAVARGERDVVPAVDDGVPEVRTLARALGSMTAAVQRRTEEREAALASRARFYHAMNHELRTPLNAIVGYLDLLLAGIFGPLPAPAHDALVRSQRATNHLRELINDVLDLAKIEAGKIEIHRTRVDVGALMEDVLATLQPVAAASAVSLHLHCPAAVLADSDTRLVRQIVLNLVSNAIKFGAPNPVTVDCRALESGPMRVAIDVTDEGPGIAPEDQERIFEEYVQLQGGKHTGTGLGLAISRRLAHALGGMLEVDSTPGRGTVFRLLLP